MNAQEIADIAEKRFVQIIQRDMPAVVAIPYYYNLISWLIKQVRLLPQPLTESKNHDTIGYTGDITDSRYDDINYNDDRLLGC